MNTRPSNRKTFLIVALIVAIGSPIVYWAGRATNSGSTFNSGTTFNLRSTMLQPPTEGPRGTCDSLGKSNLEVGSDGRGIPDSLAAGQDITAACSKEINSGQRDATSLFRLGRGYELLGDRTAALDAYQQAADGGNPTAMIRLASLLRTGNAASSSDMEKSKSWRAKALAIYQHYAEKGDTASLFVVGANSLFDEKGEVAYITSVTMPPLEEAARRGYAEEIFRLGAALQNIQWTDSFRRNNADRIASLLFETSSRNGSVAATLALAKSEMRIAEGFAKYNRGPEMRVWLNKAKQRLIVARRQGGPGVQDAADKLLNEIDNVHTQGSQAVAAFAAMFFAALANGDRGQHTTNDANSNWGDAYEEMRSRECNHAQASAAWGTGSQDFATATCLF